jgi:hypothetical protein
MAVNDLAFQGTSGNTDRRLNPNKFTNAERNSLIRGKLSDEEFESIEEDTQPLREELNTQTSGTSATAGTAGTSGSVKSEDYDSDIENYEGEGDVGCDYWEFDPNSIETTTQELQNINGLKNCNNLPDSLKDKKSNEIQIKKSVGKLENKDRIRLEITNNSQSECCFIESIRVITGTSNSVEIDKERFSNIVSNSPFLSETDILNFVNDKIIFNDESPSTLIEGTTTNIPPCLNSTNDKIGILLGPKKEDGEDKDGPSGYKNIYQIRVDLPPGDSNLIGIMGATGGPTKDGTSIHIHAEWKSKTWKKDTFIAWYKEAYNDNKFIGQCVKNNVPARITVEDLLKFIYIDLSDPTIQISGTGVVKQSQKTDFTDPDGLNGYGKFRNWNANGSAGCRHHYAIDVSGKPAPSYKKRAFRRVFAREGIKITPKGAGKTAGNYVSLRNVNTGEEIIVMHLAAIWDDNKKEYYTHADPYTTLKAINAGQADKSKTYITNSGESTPSIVAKKSPCGVDEYVASYFIDLDMAKYPNVPVWALIEINGTFEKKYLVHYFENKGK